MTVKTRIAEAIVQALTSAQHGGQLPSGETPEVVVERPQRAEHGDFATSLPLRLARSFRMDPMYIAQRLVEALPPGEEVDQVWAASPGFINFSLRRDWLTQQVEAIYAAGEHYASLDVGGGEKVQVEYVSVNPTGPLHIGHARGAVLGSTLARVLRAAGYQVAQEYYINDAGTQMELFARSLYVRYQQALGREAELAPNGYQGAYVIDLAQEVVQEHGPHFLELPEAQAVAELTELGRQKMLDAIGEDLRRIRVHFDVWFSEHSLYQEGQYQRAMEVLQERGHVVEKEGAQWFASSALGDDKDNVLVRSNGQPTYFASDVAYHYNKFLERGFQRVINVWGADHQGHVSRMKAVTGALGIDAARLHIIISQMVTLKRGQEVLRVSKRTGELVTLRELVDEVGPDACRFFFLARSAESQMDFDLELAKQQSADNPVYYVQYAHARIMSILRLAQEQSIEYEDGDVSLLTHEAELDLIRQLLLLPELVETIAHSLEPHHLPHYASELATAFHWFYQQCRVVSSEPQDLPLTKARLKLVQAARITLASALDLMGMDAPEHM